MQMYANYISIQLETLFKNETDFANNHVNLEAGPSSVQPSAEPPTWADTFTAALAETQEQRARVRRAPDPEGLETMNECFPL